MVRNYRTQVDDFRRLGNTKIRREMQKGSSKEYKYARPRWHLIKKKMKSFYLEKYCWKSLDVNYI